MDWGSILCMDEGLKALAWGLIKLPRHEAYGFGHSFQNLHGEDLERKRRIIVGIHVGKTLVGSTGECWRDHSRRPKDNSW